ncbi:hypothetical protein Q5762_09910 [Streptomyces sp. P9(2023)]|uniref:hypothetical protein n=1 Tax=Streptomyces sp. P9(2023) TaxID=3064394 RepID=UPI0028F41639|nr:hypothetical protein [Streptomyces sp. P9(2023)]MDT9688664.1 hypothetical protein [Streptomyces sp. P9(2023)]
MSPRTALPPPPPPAEIQSWPDHEARLADRARAMTELNRRLIGGTRLVVFLMWLAVLELGWGICGAGLIALDDSIDPFAGMFSFFLLGLGLCAVVPAVFFLARGARRDREARDRLIRWAALDGDRAADARLREPVLGVVWLLLAFALCAVGLWLSLAAPAEATGPGRGGYGTAAYFVGAGLGLWVSGMTAAVKAVGHYRLAVRLVA